MYYALLYTYVDNVLDKRPPFRDKHLGLLRDLHARGLLVLAGAWAEPVDGAAIIFKSEDTAIIEDFVRSDPYVRNGLVTNWQIRQWDVVVGGD